MGWTWQKTKYPGVMMRHEKACAANEGGRCRCERSYRVRYRDETGPKWSRVLKSESEARNWRKDDQGTKTVAAQSTKAGKTFNALVDDFMALAKTGGIAQSNGKKYAPGTIQAYTYMYDNHVRKELGRRDSMKLTAVDWQLWVDAMARKGLKRNSISVAFNCVRAVYRWAAAPTRRILPLNATTGVRLPAYDETPRDRVADPQEAQSLVGALAGVEKVSYALSLFAGLRNVERKSLGWEAVDLRAGKLHVRFTKGDGGAGIRTLPIPAPLKTVLRAEWMKQGQPTAGLVCRGPKGGAPDLDSMKERAAKAWEKAELGPIGWHECRHSFISTLIASGLNMKAVQVLAGHASIAITADRYGHLFPGHEDEAGAKLDVLYAGSNSPDVADVTTSVTTGASEASDLAL